MAHLRIITDSGIVQLTDTRDTLCLLGKGGTPPLATVFSAKGASTDYHFGRAPNGSSYGLTTRDGSGRVLFDAVSYGRVPKPVGVMTGDIQFVEAQTRVQTFAAGRTYAVWLANRVSAVRARPESGVIGGAMNYWYYLDRQDMTIEISGPTVSITAKRTLSDQQGGMTGLGAYEGGGKYDWAAVVLDVTHF